MMHDDTTPHRAAATTPLRPSRRYGGLLGAGALALAAVAGIVAVPVAADAATAPAKVPAVCVHDVAAVRHAYDALPTALHDDIAKARKESTTSARKEAAQKILAKAQSGGYGADVAAAAKGRKTLEGAIDAWRRLPSALRTDLKGARAATGTARADDVKSIVTKAESGGYGDRIKDATSKLKTRLDRCEAATAKTPKSPAPKSPAPSPSPSTAS
ncbi:hypothetical protein [Microbacterium sp. 22242]|uniref:hypothetical protein n=1 Tax=Microbacterium sp. 22242 TaxID=3453896 RepID=UPI003F868EF6